MSVKLTDAKSWAKVRACRACLATDVNLFDIRKNSLAENYMLMAGISVQDCFPQFLCLFCVDSVKKFVNFRKKCRKAYTVLVGIHNKGRPVYTAHIRDVHYSHKDLQIPYSISQVKIEELGNTKVQESHNINDLKDEQSANSDVFDTYFDNTESGDQNDSDDEFEHESSNEQLANLNETEIDRENNETDNTKNVKVFTIGDIIDAEGEDLEYIENKWLKGELDIESLANKPLNQVIPKRPDTEELTDMIEFLDIPELENLPLPENRVFVTFRKEITNVDYAVLAHKYDFRVKFLTKQEQIDELEESKRSHRKTTCKICGLDYSYRKGLVCHMKAAHDANNEHICELCKARFKERRSLVAHLRKHAVTFYCRICNYKTKFQMDLKRHNRKHKTVSCEHCSNRYQTSGALTKHVKKTHANLLPRCDVCNTAVVNDKGLYMHKLWAHTSLPFPCSNCPSQFFNEKALKTHNSLNMCDLSCCKHCGYGFGDFYLMKMHIGLCHNQDTMYGKLTFDCDVCEVNFHSKNALEKHYATCAKMIHCVQCGDCFENAKLLIKHSKIHQIKNINYKCGNCQEYFRNIELLQRHYYAAKNETPCQPAEESMKPQSRTATTTKVWGIVDGKVVAKRPDENKRTLNNVCEICGRGFYSLPSFIQHRLRHGEKLYACDKCPKKYHVKSHLENHINTHTGERPVQCDQCPQTFKGKMSLYQHREKHRKANHACQICGLEFTTASRVKTHITSVHIRNRPVTSGIPKKKRKTKMEDVSEDVIIEEVIYEEYLDDYEETEFEE